MRKLIRRKIVDKEIKTEIENEITDNNINVKKPTKKSSLLNVGLIIIICLGLLK